MGGSRQLFKILDSNAFMNSEYRKPEFFRRHVALPSDHGSWVFLFSPLLIGLFAGGSWSVADLYLIIAALAAFLIRQPVTILVKVFSGRRSRRDLPAAWFWIGIYAFIGATGLVGLILQGWNWASIYILRNRPNG